MRLNGPLTSVSNHGILKEALTGQEPYPDKTEQRVIVMVTVEKKHPKRPETHIPLKSEHGNTLWSLLTQCWANEPGERPKASEILETLSRLIEAREADKLALAALSQKLRVAVTPAQADAIIDRLVNNGCQDLTDKRTLPRPVPIQMRRGKFTVFCENLRDGTRVAIKTELAWGETKEADKIKRAAQELCAWSQTHHPHILPLLGFMLDYEGIQIVSPWIEYGALPGYLEKHSSSYTLRCKMSACVCRGVDYLHHVGIIHGGITAGCVLVTDKGIPVIAGFATTALQPDTLQIAGPTLRIPAQWAAPELLNGATTRSKEADIYALGMTILVISPVPPKNLSDQPSRKQLPAKDLSMT
ncbi:hypothetical protein FRC12_017415 [Ceratobasidium sp. 428]|nr:hypothetical protein FRC12_017415 [Ceratobasidium sp. 428]